MADSVIARNAAQPGSANLPLLRDSDFPVALNLGAQRIYLVQLPLLLTSILIPGTFQVCASPFAFFNALDCCCSQLPLCQSLSVEELGSGGVYLDKKIEQGLEVVCRVVSLVTPAVPKTLVGAIF
jgi:hypothetical protein